MGLLSNKTNLTGQGLGKKMPAKKKPIKKAEAEKVEIKEIVVDDVKEQETPKVESKENTEICYKEQNDEIDVNDEEKIDLSMSENSENENFSENETNKENNVSAETLTVTDDEGNKTMTINEKGEVEEVEVKPKETKKKSTRKRKSSKKKTEEVAKETDADVESITDVDEATEYLEDIINFTSEEWEDEEKILRDKLTSLEIRPDLNPDDVKKLIAKLSETYTDIKGRLVDVERSANSLEKQIKDIKTLNSIGSNATERNLAATKAVMFFKKNPDDEKTVDLEQYLLMLKHKVNFYKYCIDTMGYNRQLLITFASVFKIEINNM